MNDYEFCYYSPESRTYQVSTPNNDSDYYRELNNYIQRKLAIDTTPEIYRSIELRFLAGQRLSYIGRIILTPFFFVLILLLRFLRVFTIKET